MEVWKDIKDYEGLYQVSTYGNIRNCRKNKNNVLYKSLRTYYGVKLSKNNIKEFKSIHRLVAETFIQNPENKTEVNHKDGNKLNNKVDNLEWCNHSENQLHAYKNNLQKPTKISPVSKFDLQGNLIKSYFSIKEAKEDNKNCSKIGECCRGKRKSAGGYFWKYNFKI